VRFLLLFLLTLSAFAAPIRTANRPLAFERRGDHFLSRGPGYAFTITNDGDSLNVAGATFHMTAANANPRATLDPLDPMPGKANYILGRDLHASYDLFGRVRWRAIYPGIDIVFHGNQQRLEYDFEIAPGRDPRRIRLAFDAAIRIDPNGDLTLIKDGREIRQPKPVAYQNDHPVEVAFEIDRARRVRFRVAAYDRARPLIIDPQIVFNNSFGGSATTTAAALTQDSQGNLYVTGATNSAGLATPGAAQGGPATLAIYTSFDGGHTWPGSSLQTAAGGPGLVSAIADAPASPQILYATTPIGVFTGNTTSGIFTPVSNTGLTGAPTAVTVDAVTSNTLYVATSTTIFASTNGAASWLPAMTGITGNSIATIAAHPTQTGTVYASIFNPPSIYVSTNYGASWSQLSTPSLTTPVYSIAFSASGSIILGAVQGLLISSNGGQTWTTGATQTIYNNQQLATGSGTNVYIVNMKGVQHSSDGGQTFSVVFAPVTFTDSARIAVDPRNPSTLYVSDVNGFFYQSTNGGTNWTQLTIPNSQFPNALFISPFDSAIVIGTAIRTNIYVTKWSADGTQVLYTTYLGGTIVDQPSAIAVDSTGSAYITGLTQSPDFPVTEGAYVTKLTSKADIFVAKFSPDGSRLMYSTYMGAQDAQAAGIAVDSSGGAVITGMGNQNFIYPVTPGAVVSTPASTCNAPQPFGNAGALSDAFVTRIAAAGNALSYSTLLGASCQTYGYVVAMDANGNAWVAGITAAPDFPVTATALQSQFGGGYFDGYLSEFSPSGALVYSTFIGGSGYDSLSAIAFDSPGNIYLTGESGGLSQPSSKGAFQPAASASCFTSTLGLGVFEAQGNALVLKLDPQAHTVLGLTYLGAPLCLSGSSIAVDASGEPWIFGVANATASPQTVLPLQIGIGGSFLSKFSADFTQLQFSTWFNSIAGLALDSSGNAYVAGTSPQNTANGTQAAYLAKINPSSLAPITLNTVQSAIPITAAPNQPAIAPGELLLITGANMGPAAATPGVIVGGVVTGNVGGVEVTFDGQPAPLLSVSAQSIELIAPFELAGKSSTTIEVQTNGGQSNSVQVGVVAENIQVLGIFNDDFTVNSATNPAKSGSIISVYASGIGASNPASQDGEINTAPFAAPGVPINVNLIAGNATPITVTGVAAAPGLVAGIFQINFTAPTSGSNTVLLGNLTGSAQFSVFVQ
jgi:uncharacterized protein (TIGR03437 family)